jgi:DNA repair protein RadC
MRDHDPHTAFLSVVHEALRLCVSGRLREGPILSTSSATTEYLMLTMAHGAEEHIRVLFLNAQNRMIGDVIVSQGTIDQAPLYPRAIIRQALEVGATGVIVAHNHPSGDPEPSEDDIAVTKSLAAVGQFLDIAVLDHLVLGTAGCVSLRSRGLL